jgi:hypothetical protein
VQLRLSGRIPIPRQYVSSVKGNISSKTVLKDNGKLLGESNILFNLLSAPFGWTAAVDLI